MFFYNGIRVEWIDCSLRAGATPEYEVESPVHRLRHSAAPRTVGS